MDRRPATEEKMARIAAGRNAQSKVSGIAGHGCIGL
jgi:hypothetical protein